MVPESAGPRWKTRLRTLRHWVIRHWSFFIMPSPRVLILYNEPVLPADHADYLSEREVLDTVEHVSRALTPAGFDVVRLGVSRDPAALVAGVRDSRPDVVFN